MLWIILLALWAGPALAAEDWDQSTGTTLPVSQQKEILVRKAFEHSRALDTEVSEKILSRAITLDPKDARLYLLRGDARKQNGQFSQAVEDYSRSLALDHKDEETYLHRAFVYRATGQYQKAINDYLTAIRIRPRGRPYEYVYLAKCLIKLERYKEAVPHLEEGIKQDPNSHEGLKLLADCHMTLKNYPDAVKVYTLYIRKCPDDGAGYFGRAKAYESMGDKKQAEADRKLGKTFEIAP